MSDLPRGDRFCQSCGDPLAGTPFCGSCGAQQQAAAQRVPVSPVAQLSAQQYAPQPHVTQASVAAPSVLPASVPPARGRRTALVSIAALATLALVGTGAFAYSRGWIFDSDSPSHRIVLADVREKPTAQWIWTPEPGRTASFPVADAAGRIFVMDKSSSNTGHVVRALDPSTGEQVWETSLGWTSTPAEGGIGIDPHVIDPIGDRLIVLLSDDETYSTQAMTLSTETGAILEETTLRGQDSAPGLYLMGKVLISTDGEHASRLDPNALSAGPMWTVSGIVATDHLGDPFEGVGLLSLPTMDGDLLIDAATGEPSTVFRPPPITASIGQIGPYIIQAEHVESLWSIEAFDLEGVRLWSHSGDQFDYFLLDNGTPIIIEHRPNAIMRLDPRNGSDMWDSPLTTTGDAFTMAGLGDTIRLYDWEDGEPTTIVDVDTKEVLGSASEYLGDAAGTTTYYKDAADYSDAAEPPGGLHAWDATGRSLWSIDQPTDLHLVRAPGHLITYELDQTQITSWR